MASEPRHARAVSRRRRLGGVLLGALVVLAVAAAVWVIARGLMARDVLTGTAPQLAQIRGALSGGSGEEASSLLIQLGEATATAVDLTSDPVWLIVENVPVVGRDLVAVRTMAESADRIVRQALPPLMDVVELVESGALTPRSGRFDLDALSLGFGPVVAAEEVLDGELRTLRGLAASGLVAPVEAAILEMRTQLEEVAGPLSAAAEAARVLPGMLGADGPRRYLLIVQNNAEIRASGGAPGALAMLYAVDGELTLGVQSTAFAFPHEVAEITPDERVLYGPNFTRYMQNVTMTPNFARTGEIASTLWERRTGEVVDGVISVDPVALAHVLEATGPIDLADGTRLEASSVVEVLLSESYARLTSSQEQDAFFAAAAAAVFDRVVDGGYSARALVAALAHAAGERRLLVWSADPGEQAVIADGMVGGSLPVSDEFETAFGVYFVDNTEAKMSYYLRSAVSLRSASCRADGRPDFEVVVRLESTAPADAAESLPAYVVGGRYGLGVTKGQVRTTVFVVAPAGSEFWDVVTEGGSQAFIAGEESDRAVAGFTITLDPGESAAVMFRVLGAEGLPLDMRLDHTPMLAAVPVAREPILACPSHGTDAPIARGSTSSSPFG